MAGIFSPDLSCRGQRRRLCLFMKMSLVISWFTTFELKQIYCSYSCTRNFRMKFCNLPYYFRGQHRCWTETSVGNDFLFKNLYCVQLCYCLPLPCTAVPNRRQKGFNRGLDVCTGLLDIPIIDKTSTDLHCFIFQFVGLGALIWVA